MYWIGAAVLVLAIYVALKVQHLRKAQVLIATFLEEKAKELAEKPKEAPRDPLPYGWFDEGWPIGKVDEEERAPIENPEFRATVDEYTTQTWIAEYRSLTAQERKEFIRELRRAGVWFRSDLLDIIYGDESASVRAWAAAHLSTSYSDYSDINRSVKTRDYEPALLSDRDAIVRAALWSNPGCQQLPWRSIDVSKEWKAQFQRMTGLERLGLMRNPDLSMHYVLELLEASSEELNIKRKEHAHIVGTAAMNPSLIGSSRRHGRKFWMVEGDVNPPFEEYGRMWDLESIGFAPKN